MKSSNLASKIAQEISQLIISRELEVGQHLSALAIADRFSVSRSPARQALEILKDAGIVEQIVNRGYFVNADSYEKIKAAAPSAMLQEQTSDYQRLAEDWRQDLLPEETTELYLRKRYELTKAQLQEILVRATREGWAERKPGYGWRFLSEARTPEAFESIYQLRLAIEPAAMLLPEYLVDLKKLRMLRDEQQRMLDHDINELPVEMLLDNGVRFHEELIKFSGNPYFHQTLVRVNRMRRLLEYRSAFVPERFLMECSGHLGLLDILERGEMVEASQVMRRHLSEALRRKRPLMTYKSNDSS